MWKESSLALSPFVTLHDSHSYSNTALTSDLNSLIVVLLISWLLLLRITDIIHPAVVLTAD